MKTRIAVLVSGGGTNLQALLDAQRAGLLQSGAIALVISDREGAYAIKRAIDAKVPALIFSRKALGQEAFEEMLLGSLKEGGIDMIILAGFLTILGPEFCASWHRRILNVHPSLIPAFCGAGCYGVKVHEMALARGVKLTGASVHYVTGDVDAGPILMQKAVRVHKKDTPETLQRRVMEKAEWLLLPRAAEKVARRILREKERA
ncbi:MAG: phosphoribosylglycinamide formyltransferase [Eubacteriales bacterium]|nr:phosphoribosylglycinamide formyltransferase [Eubacteriales bacterium]MDD4104543.1 phosphoribosylglycinamide formyltransferase [Eubacteriales bacterium]MDD4710126.1 phosphoribosylglycinamide formyltransferase [Eubacteriales bacterium]NLO14619.1 phosphoribosylglycinamide formyltransferase [Clostridiales bacterium]